MIQPDIVYRHSDWIILNKPPSHSIQSLATLWKDHFSVFKPVHRLDKDTSGLWIIALSDEANAWFSRAFERGAIEKAYLAVTHKSPKKKQGKIVGDMVASRRGQWKLLDKKDNPAITQFKSIGFLDGKRLVLCLPKTGKTHQIRVAMKANGSPIVGDVIYDKDAASAADRLYLHAYGLKFIKDDVSYEFHCLPSDGTLFESSDFSKRSTAFNQPFKVFPV